MPATHTFSRIRGLCLGALSLYTSAVFSAPTIPIVVTQAGDNHPDTGGLFSPYDLRGALNQTNIAPNPGGGYLITFDPTLTATPITLQAPLPILNLVQANPLTLDGGAGITISGANSFRGFFAKQGDVTLNNLQIQNVLGSGGRGGGFGGGGGMGAGAGLFVNDGVHVTVSNVVIQSAKSRGGNGGAAGVGSPGGGGGMGGMGGSGGAGAASGGGGGLGGDGGDGITNGGGGGGGIYAGANHFGLGGSGVAGGEGGGIGGGSGGSGGGNAGGANGGGGGSDTVNVAGGGGGQDGHPNVGTTGGAAGFGGGGGGGNGNPGGAGGVGGGGGGLAVGGFGGGGGGGANGNFGGGGGGGGIGGVGGGKGDPASFSSQGGGGAAFGGGIFVAGSGTLNIQGSFSTASNSLETSSGFAPGWAAGTDCFFVTGSNITLDPNGGSITITDSIADDSAASFSGVPSGTTPGTATGASIQIGATSSTPGTVSLLGNSTYSGSTTVNQGVFILNGSITSPVTVASGAKLQGVGTVNNSVSISGGGTIHAGNSPGTLSMNSLTLAGSSSILELAIDLSGGSTSSSIYQVNGNAALNSANLHLVFTSNPTPSTNHSYNFLNYTGSLSGTFGKITNIPSGYLAQLAYLSNVVQLKLTPITDVIFINFLGAGIQLSRNERVTLNALLTLSMEPALQPIFSDLVSLTPDQFRAALDSISPARNAAATFFTNQAAFGISKMPLMRIRDKRVSHHLANKKQNSSLASTLAVKNENLVAVAAEQDLAWSLGNQQPAGKAKTAAAKPNNYGFWAAGFGDFLSQNNRNSNPEISDTSSGAVVGFDYYGYQNGIFNISAAYTHNDITEHQDTGSGSSNGAVLGVYGTGYLGCGYLEGGVLGGYNHFHMKRNVSIPSNDPFSEPFNSTAKSSFNNWLLMPHLGGGYDWMMSWGVIEPFASLDWAVSFQRAYQETGASPLNMHIKGQTPSILRSQAGVNCYETWDNASHVLLFEQSVSYINKALFNTNMWTSFLVTPTAGSFTLWTYDRTLNLAGVGAELFYKHKRSGFFSSAAYQGEFGSGFMSNEIMGTVGVFF